MFGAVGGSISLNLASESSDIDFYLVTENLIGGSITRTMHQDGDKIDFFCISLDELLEECKKFAGKPHQYPTRFYRDQSETDMLMRTADYERPDFKREMIMRIFLADEILEFKHGSVSDSYDGLKAALRHIDIWDYHFNRAYGNYHEKIRGKEKVLLRKYLYTTSEIGICSAILDSGKVIMNYKKMIEESIDAGNNKEIFRICGRLWEENLRRTDVKENCYVDAEPILNGWIEGSLNIILNNMREQEKFLMEHVYAYNFDKVKRYS